ncbi:MAG: hypothetical protein KGM93_04250 [Sphingomonadales bacterium]|nr:hypothetical protein [Sphingomonadales bacterium]
MPVFSTQTATKSSPQVYAMSKGAPPVPVLDDDVDHARDRAGAEFPAASSCSISMWSIALGGMTLMSGAAPPPSGPPATETLVVPWRTAHLSTGCTFSQGLGNMAEL